jgi:anti-anti-sigma factor
VSAVFQVSAVKGQTRTFHLAGELDLSAVEALVGAVTPSLADPGDIVFDLSKLEFVDSTGIRTFLDFGRQLHGRGRLILVSPCRPVKRVLDLMGVAGSPQTFDVRDSSETTLA